MSQVDPQDPLSRLQETIAQLQAIAMALETEEVILSETMLSNLVADAAQLVVTETRPTVTPEVSEVNEVETVTSPRAEDDAWDGDIFETPTESAKVSTPELQVTSRPRPVPSMKRSRSKPWWRQQKFIVAAISGAIALVLVFRFTLQAPEPEMVAEQPGDTAESSETVITEEPTVDFENSPTAPEEISPPEEEIVVEPAPAPVAPQPPAPLTPEQRLVAAIQRQVDDVTQPYGDNIVRGIEANFDAGILSITVGDAWYLLKAGLQDRLGAEVLNLAQLLDFQKLRVEDLEGNFVAREPVVGDTLVIYRRYQEYPELTKNS